MKGFIIFLWSVAIFSGCARKDPLNKFDDGKYIAISDFQDKRLTDSLYQFLKSPEVKYRAAAALAFASIQDTTSSGVLGNLLLEDQSPVVRRTAAFALGQTGGIAAVNALIPSLSENDPAVVREVLEALGRSIRKNDLAALARYEPKDSLTQEGLAWALYRLGLRGLADSVIAIKESEFLKPEFALSTRTAASNFFARAQIKSGGFEKVLMQAALHDASPDVRMNAVSGLRKIKKQAAYETLATVIKTEKDPHVRIAAARALGSIDPEKARALWISLLQDINVNVGIAASETLVAVLKATWPELIGVAKTTPNWRIQSNLYKAILKADYDQNIVQQIKIIYQQSGNDYQKAWLLGAIAVDQNAFPFIQEQLIHAKSPVIKTSAVDALISINATKEFPSKLRPVFLTNYKQAILDGDPAVIGLVAGALGDSSLGYKSEIKDLTFLEDAKKKLKLPRDYESLNPIEDALAYLSGKPKPTELKNAFGHPIDWNFVKKIPAVTKVKIKTSKGEIVMRLFVEENPGTVSNFLQLADSKYFDGKFFHRTVPNFVIQTGCNRGDGFGSEDYAIRSEFSGRDYQAGSVGMASSGKDTEGTQWFITHSPTPHLDGRYTNFAQVDSGMDVVEKIEVGDRIITVARAAN